MLLYKVCSQKCNIKRAIEGAFGLKCFFVTYRKRRRMSIQEKFTEYLNINKELAAIRKQMKQHKQRVDALEKEIKEYMTQNDMDSVSLKDGEIVLYAKKISQTFKKESIVEKLTEKLKDSQKAEELTQSILSNKKFVVEDKIKAVIKKKD